MVLAITAKRALRGRSNPILGDASNELYASACGGLWAEVVAFLVFCKPAAVRNLLTLKVSHDLSSICDSRSRRHELGRLRRRGRFAARREGTGPARRRRGQRSARTSGQ